MNAPRFPKIVNMILTLEHVVFVALITGFQSIMVAFIGTVDIGFHIFASPKSLREKFDKAVTALRYPISFRFDAIDHRKVSKTRKV